MKKIFTLVISGLLYTLCSSAQNKVLIEEAPKHIGETVTICSKVTGGRFMENVESKPTLLNMGGVYPNHKVTLLIKPGDRKNFSGNPEENYTGKNVCVTGKLIEYKGKPEVIVSKPQEIQIQTDGGGGDHEIKTKDFFWFE